MFVIDGDLVAGLPAAHRAPDGQMRTGLSAMTDDELAGIGIYPATVVKPAVSGTQYYGAPTVEIADGRATATYPVLDYSAAEVWGMLEKAKAAKVLEIQAASDAAIARIEVGYTQGEVKSWERQRQGAIDILNGDATTENAVYVTALANARIAAGDAEMTVTAFAERIKANSDAATALGIATLGKQQGLEARIRSVTLDQVGGKLAAAIAVVETIAWE